MCPGEGLPPRGLARAPHIFPVLPGCGLQFREPWKAWGRHCSPFWAGEEPRSVTRRDQHLPQK